MSDRVTLADIVVVSNLYLGFTRAFDPAFRKPFPNVTRYFETLVNQPEFARVLGKVELAKAAPKYEPGKVRATAPGPVH